GGKRRFAAPGGAELYDYCRKDDREASVTREITAAAEVTGLTLPTGSWLNEAAFALSATNDNDAAFEDGRSSDIRLDAHTVTAAVPDAFSGKLYAYVLCSADAPEDAALRVRYTEHPVSSMTSRLPKTAKPRQSLMCSSRARTETWWYFRSTGRMAAARSA
ncbi:MAG: hypothetical protein V8T01_09000, partial [Oscillospiraceae bacterium]